jgi:hypothetical protein
MGRTGLKTPVGWNIKSRCAPDFDTQWDKLQTEGERLYQQCSTKGQRAGVSVEPLSFDRSRVEKAYRGWLRAHPEVVHEFDVRQWAFHLYLRHLVVLPIDRCAHDAIAI